MQCPIATKLGMTMQTCEGHILAKLQCHSCRDVEVMNFRIFEMSKKKRFSRKKIKFFTSPSRILSNYQRKLFTHLQYEFRLKLFYPKEQKMSIYEHISHQACDI